MNIQFSANVPNSTYFRTGDAEPDINPDGSLTVYEGTGSRRSWGHPGIGSTVVLDDCDLVAIHVGFYHKHGGGQFWRYFTTDGTITREIGWKDLSDDQRQLVLNAYQAKAPSWAKVPGKLRNQYIKPSVTTRRAYKLVELRDGRMLSLFDGETKYVIGKRLAEKARDEHNGGYYSHPTPEQAIALWNSGSLVPERCYRNAKTMALIECEIGGTIVDYANGKIASTYLTPIAVLETIEYIPA